MLKQMCAVFDHASGLFGSPFFVAAVGQAIRSFTDEVNRAAPDNALHAHPEDFDLHCLGQWDDQTGDCFQPDRRVLVRGKEVKEVRS